MSPVCLAASIRQGFLHAFPLQKPSIPFLPYSHATFSVTRVVGNPVCMPAPVHYLQTIIEFISSVFYHVERSLSVHYPIRDTWRQLKDLVPKIKLEILT